MYKRIFSNRLEIILETSLFLQYTKKLKIALTVGQDKLEWLSMENYSNRQRLQVFTNMRQGLPVIKRFSLLLLSGTKKALDTTSQSYNAFL